MDSTAPRRMFRQNIGYAQGLIQGGSALATMQAGVLDPADLYRAAWTQAVSAFDHWLHEEVYVRVPKLVRRGPGGRSRRLGEVTLPFSVVDRIQNDHLEIGDAFQEQLKNTINRTSFHQPRAISEAVQYVVEIKHGELWTELATRLNNRDGTTWRQDSMQEEHIRVLNRRNEIAHAADIDPATGERRPMVEADADAAVTWLANLGAVLTEFLDARDF